MSCTHVFENYNNIIFYRVSLRAKNLKGSFVEKFNTKRTYKRREKYMTAVSSRHFSGIFLHDLPSKYDIKNNTLNIKSHRV